MKAVIRAAGLGTRLGAAAGGLPKCMVKVAGQPIVDRMIERIGEAGIDEVIVVTGYQREVLERHLAASPNALARKATCVFNPRFADWGNFYTLLCAEQAVAGDSFVAFDGDVVMDGTLLPTLLRAPGPAALAIDCRPGLGDEEMKARVEGGRIVELNKRIDPAKALGEFVGIERIDAAMGPKVFGMLRQVIERGETHDYYERAYELLMQGGARFEIADVTSALWSEIDDAADLAAAEELLARM